MNWSLQLHRLQQQIDTKDTKKFVVSEGKFAKPQIYYVMQVLDADPVSKVAALHQRSSSRVSYVPTNHLLICLGKFLPTPVGSC